ncbi:hypothetical protein A3L04_06440 [Thermococcus chitonophagus]|uniref:Uncharacterized protein n=1 Tax=Thermococcus chitonophagus TaxID=54262 RepID=A0A160VTC2_9EURY|nr:hypothetical protein [Thermococcus chitonophagus]ASJ16736.1 hypothetical protein A3L04_06440 [Thermococcus chitonophagus]CUX78202.1 hypothetical protein CHITON_1423 [Thermococcus chitonophagus]
MRKRERQLVTIGLVFLFGIIAYAAYAGWFDGAPIPVLDKINKDNETYQLDIKDIKAEVLENGHVKLIFNITNYEHFNLSSVQVLYALNVADPENATYVSINASTLGNGTYATEIPSTFGDTVYYKVKVEYNQNKTFETKVYTIQVKDTVPPKVNGVTITYNATTGNATITVNATDNDAIKNVIIYYAITQDGNLTNATWANATLTAAPWVATIKVDANITDTTYYYLDLYVIAQDLSGNEVRYPANGTIHFYANETTTISG